MKIKAIRDDDKPHVRLEHEHMRSLGLDGPLKAGTNVHYEGHGEVMESGTHEDMDGELRHHMTIRMNRHGIEHDAEDGKEAGEGLRGELRKNTDASESKKAEGDVRRGGAKTPTGEKVAEKA